MLCIFISHVCFYMFLLNNKDRCHALIIRSDGRGRTLKLNVVIFRRISPSTDLNFGKKCGITDSSN